MNRTTRCGDWIQTSSNVEFYPFDPRPAEILIEDIAHSLSMQCRYAGHTRQFYSVAEHSIRVCELCPPELELRLWGLLHDASEAYLVDLPRPVKRYSDLGTRYCEAEDLLLMQICERFGLPWPMPPAVEKADKAMLWVESQALMPAHTCWLKWRSFTTGNERPIESTMTPAEAEASFLSLFRGLELCRVLKA